MGEWLEGLLNHPVARTVIVLSVVACIGAAIQYMKERDQRLLSEGRARRDQRDRERIATVAERVGKLSGASGATQQSISNNGLDAGQIGRSTNSANR